MINGSEALEEHPGSAFSEEEPPEVRPEGDSSPRLGVSFPRPGDSKDRPGDSKLRPGDSRGVGE